jgi:hypothetical protein
MDQPTALALLGGAIGSAKLLEKLLGPTADELGLFIRDFSRQRMENAKKIIECALDKSEMNTHAGRRVAPRVLKHLLDEGSVVDDELAIEYFGGLLASSRTDASCDDRGVYYLSLLSRMSSYQIRAHYVCYYCIWRCYEARGEMAIRFGELPEYTVRLPIIDFIRSLGLCKEPVSVPFFLHTLSGLLNLGLVDPAADRVFGNDRKKLAQGHVVVSPTMTGIELFIWAHGLGNTRLYDWLSHEYDIPASFPGRMPQKIEPIPLGAHGIKRGNRKSNRNF